MQKIFITAIAVLALVSNACKNHSGCEVELGTYTGTKNGITYILVIDSAMGDHAVGDTYTFTANGQGIDRIGSGRVTDITYYQGDVIFTLQPSYPDAPAFRVYTIDIWIVFIDDGTMTFNDGSTMKGPGSFATTSNRVKPSIPTITMQDDGHGFSTADTGQNPEPGTTVTIYATPDPGYAFLGWQVISGGVMFPSYSTSPTTFTMPANSVTIKALFTALNPAIEIVVYPLVYHPSNLKGVNSYGYSGGISELIAGTIYITYIDANGSSYPDPGSGVSGMDAGIYGIYVTAGGLNGYPAITGVNIGTLIIDKANGDPVGIPTPFTSSPAYNSMRINTVVAPGNGQAVEYATGTDLSADPADLDWQPGVVFSGLTPDTDYYIFARSQENTNYKAGAPSVSLLIHTPSPPAITIVEGDITLTEGGDLGDPRGIKQLTVTDGTGTPPTVSWTSSHPGVATVDGSGLVTSYAPGSTRITATYGLITYTVVVSVQRLSWLTDINGSLAAERASAQVVNKNITAGKFTLRARGEVNVNRQIFGFMYVRAAGDFTMTVKIDSVSFGTGTGTSPVAGIVAIPQAGFPPPNPVTGELSGYPTDQNLLYASSTLSMSLGSSTRRFWRRVRDTSGNDYAQVQIGTGTAPDTALNNGRWLKLSRTLGDFTAAYSEDGGINWFKMPNQTNHPGAPDEVSVFSGDVYVGLWVAAGQGTSNYTTAGFSEWSFVDGNGDASQAQLSATSAQVNISNLP